MEDKAEEATPEERRLAGQRRGGRRKGNGLHAPDDPDTLALIKRAIMDGLTPRSAAVAIGIPEATYYDWMGTCPEFSLHVKQCAADLKQLLAKRVMKQTTKNWAASMTMLERLWPEEYGRRDRVRHEHQGQIGLTIEPARLDAQSISMLADLEDRLAAQDEADMLALPPHDEAGPASE